MLLLENLMNNKPRQRNQALNLGFYSIVHPLGDNFDIRLTNIQENSIIRNELDRTESNIDNSVCVIYIENENIPPYDTPINDNAYATEADFIDLIPNDPELRALVAARASALIVERGEATPDENASSQFNRAAKENDSPSAALLEGAPQVANEELARALARPRPEFPGRRAANAAEWLKAHWHDALAVGLTQAMLRKASDDGARLMGALDNDFRGELGRAKLATIIPHRSKVKAAKRERAQNDDKTMETIKKARRELAALERSLGLSR